MRQDEFFVSGYMRNAVSEFVQQTLAGGSPPSAAELEASFAELVSTRLAGDKDAPQAWGVLATMMYESQSASSMAVREVGAAAAIRRILAGKLRIVDMLAGLMMVETRTASVNRILEIVENTYGVGAMLEPNTTYALIEIAIELLRRGKPAQVLRRVLTGTSAFWKTLRSIDSFGYHEADIIVLRTAAMRATRLTSVRIRAIASDKAAPAAAPARIAEAVHALNDFCTLLREWAVANNVQGPFDRPVEIASALVMLALPFVEPHASVQQPGLYHAQEVATAMEAFMGAILTHAAAPFVEYVEHSVQRPAARPSTYGDMVEVYCLAAVLLTPEFRRAFSAAAGIQISLAPALVGLCANTYPSMLGSAVPVLDDLHYDQLLMNDAANARKCMLAELLTGEIGNLTADGLRLVVNMLTAVDPALVGEVLLPTDEFAIDDLGQGGGGGDDDDEYEIMRRLGEMELREREGRRKVSPQAQAQAPTQTSSAPPRPAYAYAATSSSSGYQKYEEPRAALVFESDGDDDYDDDDDDGGAPASAAAAAAAAPPSELVHEGRGGSFGRRLRRLVDQGGAPTRTALYGDGDGESESESEGEPLPRKRAPLRMGLSITMSALHRLEGSTELIAEVGKMRQLRYLSALAAMRNRGVPTNFVDYTYGRLLHDSATGGGASTERALSLIKAVAFGNTLHSSVAALNPAAAAGLGAAIARIESQRDLGHVLAMLTGSVIHRRAGAREGTAVQSVGAAINEFFRAAAPAAVFDGLETAMRHARLLADADLDAVGRYIARDFIYSALQLYAHSPAQITRLAVALVNNFAVTSGAPTVLEILEAELRQVRSAPPGLVASVAALTAAARAERTRGPRTEAAITNVRVAATSAFYGSSTTALRFE